MHYIVHGVAKSQTQLSNFHSLTHSFMYAKHILSHLTLTKDAYKVLTHIHL